jgi:Zn-dependent protease
MQIKNKFLGIDGVGYHPVLIIRVAQMNEEPLSPKSEFWIAVAGPFSSLFLFALFLILMMTVVGGTKALFSYLVHINLMLGVFNVIPGFPMDGGRILRISGKFFLS